MNTLPINWSEVAKLKGLPEAMPFDLSMLDTVTQNYLYSAYRLPIVIETLNDGWVPDYTDSSQYKYEIWLNIIADKERPSGFGLVYYVYLDWSADSAVGVRFCFKDQKTALYAIKYFMTDFERFILKIA